MIIAEVKITNQLFYELNLELPKYSTDGSAGLDLFACIDKPLVIKCNECLLISSGIAINLSNSQYAGFLYPRSGLGHKHGIILGNSVGIIDSDYQGEIKISCWNRSKLPYTIEPKERIAQLVVQKIEKINLNIVENFNKKTKRADGGFGHTGKV